MTNEILPIVEPFGKLPTLPFKWRMNGGKQIDPKDMATNHLFNTFKMIWNNSAPAELRVGNVKLYTFGPSYTRHYMRDAVKAIGNELHERIDLLDWQRDQLNEMAAHFIYRLNYYEDTINGR